MRTRDALVRRARDLRPAGAPPRLSRPSWAFDSVIALVLAVYTVIGDLNRSYVEAQAGPDVAVPPPARLPSPPAVPHPVPVVEHTLPPVEPWELLAAVLTALPLLMRRRYPLAAYWAVMGATLLLHRGAAAADATTVTFASGLIAAYSAAVYSPHRKAVAGSLIAGAVLYAVFPLVPDVDKGLVPVLVLLPVGLAAHGIHTWRQRARALEAEQRAALRRAVDQERSRIARELHDVVTHNVSMMTIQTGAARKVLDADPDRAREALLAVEAAGRSAMSELRQVMGLLTMTSDGPDPAADADLAPQPGLDRLPELADRVRDGGVPVELTVRGAPARLPGGVDLAAYRVVQEALTNTVKHAAGAAVSVLVQYAPGELRVEVTDSGGRPRPPGPGGGRGLAGLRERLALYGGTLDTGPRPGGGFRVRAVLPVEGP
ncbi:histidine kinase [Streptomyces sp. NBC_00335]|uniref:sensor histidine kinase n=1 Tax=unclassified Streptomyces TaxID=2593676 RepID=UPI0022566AAD|nr:MULTISPECIES: histidine kinase [unclassified Streptomyces]MCX5408810.1 histidine kinase [Streptomyces sp. NBC_00086]